jgi:hypothetical protein
MPVPTPSPNSSALRQTIHLVLQYRNDIGKARPIGHSDDCACLGPRLLLYCGHELMNVTGPSCHSTRQSPMDFGGFLYAENDRIISIMLSRL